jgi:Carboxypeptidase regulatory-like domain
VALIRGLVLDAAGQPVAMAAIYVVSAPVPQRDIAQLSGPDGRFALAAPVAGTYVIGARADAAGEGTGSIAVGNSPDQEVQLRITLVRG